MAIKRITVILLSVIVWVGGFWFTTLPFAKAADDSEISKEDSQSPEDKRWPLFPVIYYTQETGLALDAMAPFAYQWRNALPDSRPNSLVLMAFYTTKNKVLISVAPEFYWQQSKNKLNLKLSFSSWPETFFGVDNDISKDEEGEDFDSNNVLFKTAFSRNVFRAFRARPVFSAHHINIKKLKQMVC